VYPESYKRTVLPNLSVKKLITSCIQSACISHRQIAVAPDTFYCDEYVQNKYVFEFPISQSLKLTH